MGSSRSKRRQVQSRQNELSFWKLVCRVGFQRRMRKREVMVGRERCVVVMSVSCYCLLEVGLGDRWSGMSDGLCERRCVEGMDDTRNTVQRIGCDGGQRWSRHEVVPAAVAGGGACDERKWKQMMRSVISLSDFFYDWLYYQMRGKRSMWLLKPYLTPGLRCNGDFTIRITA